MSTNLSKILLKIADRSKSDKKYIKYRNAAMKIDLHFSPHNVMQSQLNVEERYDAVSSRLLLTVIIIVAAVAAFGIYFVLPDMINSLKGSQWMVTEWEW